MWLLYSFPFSSQFLEFIQWMVLDLIFFFCVNVKTLYSVRCHCNILSSRVVILPSRATIACILYYLLHWRSMVWLICSTSINWNFVGVFMKQARTPVCFLPSCSFARVNTQIFFPRKKKCIIYNLHQTIAAKLPEDPVLEEHNSKHE